MRERAGAILIILALLSASFFALENAVASFYSLLVREHMNAWSSTGVVPDEHRWRWVEQNFDTAEQLTPQNADIYQQGGRLYEWRHLMAQADPGSDRDPDTALERAIAHYRMAVSLRPTWPYAWLDMVAVKHRAEEYDDEFNVAFSEVMKLGFWDRDIQRTISAIGWARFNLLEQENRNALWEMSGYLAVSKPKILIEAAREGHRLPMVCSAFDKNRRMGQLCAKHGIYLTR